MNVKFCDIKEIPIKKCKAHSHKYWEMILHLNGNNITTIENKEYSISPGDVMIIPPNTVHSGKSDTYYNDIYIQVENMDFSAVTVIHDNDGSILSLLKLLHKAYVEKEKNYIEITDSLFETICLYLHKYRIDTYKYPFVNELKNVIYENISNADFSILETVKKMGFNSDYVRRCYKEELGMTPLEYLTKLRIDTAKKLLIQETFISVEAVSFECGFYDCFYFSRLFKKHVGVSPANYRKMCVNRK